MRNQGGIHAGRLIMTILGIVIIVYLLMTIMSTKNEGYQAVFLSNEQIYFGLITDEDKYYVTLEDVYYLERDGGEGISLVRLGNELHKPQNMMRIGRNNLMLIEPLAVSSPIVEAIEEDKR